MVGFGNNRSFMADYLQVGQVEQAWTEHLKVKYSKEEAGCDDDVAGLGGSENQAKRSQVVAVVKQRSTRCSRWAFVNST